MMKKLTAGAHLLAMQIAGLAAAARSTPVLHATGKKAEPDPLRGKGRFIQQDGTPAQRLIEKQRRTNLVKQRAKKS